MLTPQAIKDQEFQQKFRGYDAIEVKAYLELLAEDYFELTEQIRIQAEEIEVFTAEKESFEAEKERVAGEVQSSLEEWEQQQSETADLSSKKAEEIESLKSELVKLKETVETLEGENETYQDLLADLELKIASREGAIDQEQTEVEGLQAQLKILEQENEELKKEGVDFKTTIVAAQKFSESLRESSETEAKKLMDTARTEVENYRNEMAAELAMYPKKIEELKQRKNRVRDELKKTLNSYMEAIDVFSDAEHTEQEEDYSELFQSIHVPDRDDYESGEMEKRETDLT